MNRPAQFFRSFFPLLLALLLLSTRAIAAPGTSAPEQPASSPPAQPPAPPTVFQCDGRALATARLAWINHDPAYKQAFADLRSSAEKSLAEGPFTIVNKQHSLPNVDPHDYVSLAPYFWPNPDTATGLPYIRRDGQRNPEIHGYDAEPFSQMSAHVYTLSLAGYLSGDRRFSDRAALLIRVWFFDPATRMNPNLQHAQFVQGVNEGRGTGIIESNRLFDVIDGIGLLNATQGNAWSQQDQAKFNTWLTDYRNWMQISANGQSEAAAANNHGSWYAAQLTAYSLFLGDPATAKRTADAAENRIAHQILPDGEQPLELARTKSFGYSTFNLSALTMLANLAQRVGVDLWNFKTNDGRGIRAAIDFLIPYAVREKPWPHQQLGQFSGEALFVPLRRAAAAYQDPRYDRIADRLEITHDIIRYPPAFPDESAR